MEASVHGVIGVAEQDEKEKEEEEEEEEQEKKFPRQPSHIAKSIECTSSGSRKTTVVEGSDDHIDCGHEDDVGVIHGDDEGDVKGEMIAHDDDDDDARRVSSSITTTKKTTKDHICVDGVVVAAKNADTNKNSDKLGEMLIKFPKEEEVDSGNTDSDLKVRADSKQIDRELHARVTGDDCKNDDANRGAANAKEDDVANRHDNKDTAFRIACGTMVSGKGGDVDDVSPPQSQLTSARKLRMKSGERKPEKSPLKYGRSRRGDDRTVSSATTTLSKKVKGAVFSSIKGGVVKVAASQSSTPSPQRSLPSNVEKSSPSSPSPSSSSPRRLYERGMKKIAERERMRREVVSEKRNNKLEKRSARKSKVDHRMAVPAWERLYKQANKQPRRSKSAGLSTPPPPSPSQRTMSERGIKSTPSLRRKTNASVVAGSIPVWERLYAQGKEQRRSLSRLDRDEKLACRKRMEEDELQQCTFHPEIYFGRIYARSPRSPERHRCCCSTPSSNGREELGRGRGDRASAIRPPPYLVDDAHDHDANGKAHGDASTPELKFSAENTVSTITTAWSTPTLGEAVTAAQEELDVTAKTTPPADRALGATISIHSGPGRAFRGDGDVMGRSSACSSAAQQFAEVTVDDLTKYLGSMKIADSPPSRNGAHDLPSNVVSKRNEQTCYPSSPVPSSTREDIFVSEDNNVVAAKSTSFCAEPQGRVTSSPVPPVQPVPPSLVWFDDTFMSEFERCRKNGILRTDPLHDVLARRVTGPHGLVAIFDKDLFCKKRLSSVPPKVSVTSPFDDGAPFNFNMVPKSEVLLRVPAGEDAHAERGDGDSHGDDDDDHDHHNLLVNVSPLMYGHGLLIPWRRQCLPQLLTPAVINVALRLLRMTGRPRDMRVGFNSLAAFSSVNHLHLHVMYPNELGGSGGATTGGLDMKSRPGFPIEHAPVARKLSGLDERNARSVAVVVVHLLDWIVPAFSFCTANTKNRETASNKVKDRVLGDALGHFIVRLTVLGIPHNVLFIPGPRVIVIPRKPQHLFDVKNSGFNAALGEISGLLFAKSHEHYNEFTEQSVIELLRKSVACDTSLLDRLISDMQASKSS